MTEKKENFNILTQYIQDLSIETPNVETFLHARENILKYQLNIEIGSKPVKDKVIEVTTKFIFQNNTEGIKKSHFEIKYATVISLSENIKDRDEVKKIVLCDLQKKIFPKLKDTFILIIKEAGFNNIKFDKNIDFDEMYNKQIN